MAAAGVATVFTAMVVLQLIRPGGLTRFGGFGEHFEHRYIEEIKQVDAFIKPNSGGYDGQFYAQLATDPSLQNPHFEEAIDEPAYRSRRILLPAIAHLLALGNPEASILVYCSLNIIIWYAFAFFIWSWLKVSDARGFAKWTACVLSMGVMDSVKYSLTDLPSVFLILALIRYASSQRILVSGGFIASLFLKETNLLAMAAIPHLKGSPREWVKPMVRWVISSVIAIALFYFWYRSINLRFGNFNGVSGNFDWPLVSMVRNLWQAILELYAGNWDDRYIFRTLSVIGFGVQIGYLVTRIPQFRDPMIRLGLIYGFLFLFLGDLVWWGYWAVCRVALPMTIAFNLVYSPTKTKYFWSGIILANITIVHAIYRFL